MGKKKLLEGFSLRGDLIDIVSAADAVSKADAAIAADAGEAAAPRVCAKPETLPGITEAPSVPVPELPPAPSAPEAAHSPESGTAFPKETLIHEKEGLFQVFKIGGLSYRLGGVKPLFVTSLRVNIRVSNGAQTYYDSLDLYTARARSSFALSVQRTLGEEPARVEQDLVSILEYLEAERDKSLVSKKDEGQKPLSEAERMLGLELLKDPKLFERIVEDLSSLGYVGEELNKQLLYLCASSRKLDDPISVLILSQSSSGKSYLVDSVKKLMPPDEVVAVTSLSDQALNYIEDLSHKFLVLGEAVHGEVVEHQIREMLSGKELSRLVTIKDADTGKLQSRVVKTPVIVASVMGSTNYKVNPENASRCFVINTDESEEQTERIHEVQRRKYSLERIQGRKAELEKIIMQHQAAQRLLVKHEIVNPFAQYLNFPTTLMRMRRDHDRFLDLIACVCFLRQFQKKLKSEKDMVYLECDLEDYQIAYRIMVEGVLISTMRELPKGSVELYDKLRKWVKGEAKSQGLEVPDIRFTQRQLREGTGYGHTWVKANMKKLVEYEYLEIVSGGSMRNKGYYRLRGDEEIVEADLSMIPRPEGMKKLLKGRRP